MLDIYYADKQNANIFMQPDEEQYLGSIDLHEHKSLVNIFKECEKKGLYFPYFEDSKLDANEVESMLNVFFDFEYLIKDSFSKKSYKLMISILTAAIEKNRGIITYCD